MPNIDQINISGELTSLDRFLIYDRDTGAARTVTADTALSYYLEEIINSGQIKTVTNIEYENQYVILTFSDGSIKKAGPITGGSGNGVILVNGNPANSIIAGSGIGFEYSSATKQATLSTISTASIGNHFVGIYQDLPSLQDAVKHPDNNYQAIAISPSEKYFHSVGGQWVELAPVGAIHPTYIGAYDTVQDLQAASPSAADQSVAIIGTQARAFYIKLQGIWNAITGSDLPSLTARVQVVESGLSSTTAIAHGNTAAIQQLNQSVNADMQVMQYNIAQKISGIHVEDVHNNAFSDVNAIHAIGGTFSYDGEGQVTFTIDKRVISVSNGQAVGAVHFDVEGFEFPGSVITTRNNGKIAVVALTSPPPPASGVSITDGKTTVSDVKTLTVKGKVEDNGGGAAEFLPGIDMSQQFGDYKMLEGIFEIDTKWPIEVHETFNNPNVVTPGVAVLAIDPRAYEYQHGPSTLLQADADISIGGQKAQAIYLPQEIVPTGTYMSLNPVKKGLNVQDSSGNDPLLTGGQLTEILANVAFTGNAPENGTIKAWIEYQDASGTLPAGVLVDVNGAPMMVEQAYFGGDALRPLVLWGAMRAKIEAPIMLMIQTSFGTSDIVVLDAERTLLCVNQFTRGYETSLARIEFQRRTGFSLTPIIHQFTGPWASLKSELEGATQAFTTLPAGAGYDVLNQFGVQNLTTVAARIQNGALGVHGNGVPADFYVDYISDNTRTRMLRGRNVQAVIKMANRNAAFRLELYSWGGSPDKATPIYDTRTNTAIDVKPSWTLVKSVAIPENASGAAVEYTVTGTIPTSAQNFAVIIRPEVPVDPCSMELSGFTVEAVDVFTGYAEIGQINTAETHLVESDVYAEFGTTAAGYAAVRYTIGTSAVGGYPMPIGKQMKGAAPIKLNNALNRVGGSQVPQYDGVLQYDADGEVQQSVTYLLRNEGSSPVNVDFWAVLYNVGATEGSETEVAGSRKQYTIPANTKAPGVYVTLPAFSVDVLSGQSIGYRAKGDVAGAYIQSDTSSQYLTQTVVDFKQQTAGGADDPFSGIDMSSFTNVRYGFATADIDFFNKSSINVQINIPDDVDLVVLSAIKENQDLSVESVAKLGWKYFNATKTLSISFGETVPVGRVILGISV